MAYEKFFASTLKREYKSLFQINVRDEMLKYNEGYPHAIIHAFFRRGCNTIGCIDEYINKHSEESIRGIGKKRMEYAKKMVNKYRTEALLTNIKSDELIQLSKIDGSLNNEYNSNLDYPYYLVSIKNMNELEFDLTRSSDYTITIMKFNDNFEIILNGIFYESTNNYDNKESIINISEKEYYKLINYFNSEMKKEEGLYEI